MKEKVLYLYDEYESPKVNTSLYILAILKKL